MHGTPECKGRDGEQRRIKERRKMRDLFVEKVKVWQGTQGPAPQIEKETHSSGL